LHDILLISLYLITPFLVGVTVGMMITDNIRNREDRNVERYSDTVKIVPQKTKHIVFDTITWGP